MKKALLIYAALMMSIWASAQTQEGYVKSLGRPDKAGEPLGGVSVRVKGGHNEVLSGSDGTFEMRMDGKKNGEAYALQSVQKAGYELNENDIIGRQFAFSDKVRLEIVMVSLTVLQAEKQRIEDNAYRTAERNFKAKKDALKQQLHDNAITEQQYREQIAELWDKFEKYQSLIDGLAEHYAHTDYDKLNETDREINICIESGDLERADSLINTLFDPIGVLERNMNALASIEQQIGHAQGIIDQANEDMAAVLKQQEKDAEYLYQLYTIALARYDNEKAQQYIVTRALLDTTNASRQFDAAYYFDLQNDFNQSEMYYLRALAIARNEQYDILALSAPLNNLALLYYRAKRFTESEMMFMEALKYRKQLAQVNAQAYEPVLVQTLNNLALLYSDTQRFTESEAMHLEALEIKKKLAQNNPKAFEPDEAGTLNNLANLYSDTQRFTESESLYLEALKIRRRLAQGDPQTYEPDLAMTLNNLAYLYFNTQRLTESETMYLEALEIRRKLAQNNSQSYESDLAMTLNNLALLYSDTQRQTEGEALYLEALEIFRKLAQNNPQTYEPDLAMTLNNIATLYKDIQHITESEMMYLEALEINRKLAQSNPQAYNADLAGALYNLALLYSDTQRLSESENLHLEALDIYKQLAKNNPQAYEPNLATTLTTLALLYSDTQRQTESEALHLEALEIKRKLAQNNPQAYESDLADTLGFLGILYIQQKQYHQAIGVLKEALEIYRKLKVEDPTYDDLYQSTIYILSLLYPSTEDLANTLGNQSIQYAFSKEFAQAEQLATEALTINPLQRRTFSILAAVQLFQSKYDKAEEIYRSFKDELKDSFLQDLIDFEAAGVIPEERKADVEHIKQLLNQ